MNKIINKIKLFFFHLWWGKDAFKIYTTENPFKNGDVITNGKHGGWFKNTIILNNGKKIVGGYKYIVKPVKNGKTN